MADAASCDHIVQLYQDEDFLNRAVCRFVGAGLSDAAAGSGISLNYRFDVTRDPNLGIGTNPRTEHDVQLRFSYVLF